MPEVIPAECGFVNGSSKGLGTARRPSAGEDINDVEVLEVPDELQKENEPDDALQLRHRDGEEAPDRAGSVHFGGFVQLARHCLKTSEEHDHDPREGLPRL